MNNDLICLKDLKTLKCIVLQIENCEYMGWLRLQVIDGRSRQMTFHWVVDFEEGNRKIDTQGEWGTSSMWVGGIKPLGQA